MGQKKQKKRPQKPTAKNGAPQQHAQKNFLALVEEASLKKVQPYINQTFQQLAMQMQQEQNLGLSSLARRLVVLEEIVGEKLGVSLDELTERVYDLEDKDSGYEKAEEVKDGSLVRLTIATKVKDQEEFQGESTLVVTDTNNEPLTLGPDLEPALVGLKTGESKEISFGKDEKMVAKVTVLRVSEKVEAPKLAPVAETTEETQEETVDESQNAGE